MEVTHFTDQRADPTAPEMVLLKGQLLSRLALRLSHIQNRETLLYRISQFPIPLLADWCVLDVESEGTFVRKHVVFGDSTHSAAADRLRNPPPVPSDHDYPRILQDENLLQWTLSSGLALRWGMEIPIHAPSTTVVLTLLKHDAPATTDDSWYLEVGNEISHLCRMALESSNALQTVSDKLRKQDQVRSIVSHELNNSLSLLNLQLELLAQWVRKNAELPEKLDRMLSDMQLQVRSMPRQIEDMLRLNSFDCSEIALNIETFRLDDFVSQILNQYEEMLKKTGITSSIDIPHGLEVTLDPFRMREVLTNLLTNSIKYAPGSAIRIASHINSDQLIIEYSDSGPGISAEAANDVFTPFHRIPAQSKSASGTGMGLYIVKKIVLAHQGTITITSEEGAGTKFTISLPRAALR
jgi:signal transduction histidine kinase